MNERIKALMEQAKRPLGELQPKMANTGAKWDMVLDPEKFAELIIRQSAYYADVFSSMGCPDDMDPTETKPSDYIKRQMGIME